MSQASAQDVEGNKLENSGFEALVSTPYYACASCHGWKGEGKAAKSAPPLAGLEAQYVEQQMLNFALGMRGTSTDDTLGMQMALIAAAYTPDQLTQISNIVGNMPKLTVEPVENNGSPNENGRLKFENCSACHGANGQGVEGMAPDLSIFSEEYIVRQLYNYKTGLRGYHEEDVDGQVMAEWVISELSEPGDIESVAAYVKSLSGEE